MIASIIYGRKIDVTLGPIEMVVIGFPGSRFTGDIRPRIMDLVDNGVVNIVDALFVRKDSEGLVDFVELQELSDDADAVMLGAAIASQLDLLSDEDIEELAEALQPGSSALAIVFEHTWIRPVRDAVVASGGVLLADIHIPAAVVDEVLSALEDGVANHLDRGQSNGSHPYAAGLRWDLDMSRPRGRRFSNVQVRDKATGAWAPLDPARIYVLVTNDFVAAGRDGYATLGPVYAAGRFVNTYLLYTQTFVDYLSATGPLARPPRADYAHQNVITRDGVTLP